MTGGFVGFNPSRDSPRRTADRLRRSRPGQLEDSRRYGRPALNSSQRASERSARVERQSGAPERSFRAGAKAERTAEQMVVLMGRQSERQLEGQRWWCGGRADAKAEQASSPLWGSRGTSEVSSRLGCLRWEMAIGRTPLGEQEAVEQEAVEGSWEGSKRTPHNPQEVAKRVETGCDDNVLTRLQATLPFLPTLDHPPPVHPTITSPCAPTNLPPSLSTRGIEQWTSRSTQTAAEHGARLAEHGACAAAHGAAAEGAASTRACRYSRAC